MKFLTTFIFVQLISFSLLAQPGPPPPDPGDPVPVTGIELLLVGGAAIGVRKFYKRRSSTNKNVD